MAVLLFAGCPSAPPAEPMDQYRPYMAPSAVTSLEATNGYENEITLTWDRSDNASEYQIWMIKASDYGAMAGPADTDMNYTRLQERGFKLIGVTEENTYKLEGLSHNKAYVFSVLAMRGVGTEADRGVLYSDIGNYAEGSTIGDIAFAAVALSDEVVLSWQVNGFYSVLPAVPGTREALFDEYSFSVEYRRADEASFTSIPMPAGDDSMIYRMDCMELGLQLDTDYIFKVVMNVLDGGKVISRNESFEFPVHTSSDFTFAPVRYVTATRNAHASAVDVSWQAPRIPAGIDFENVFEVQRKVWDENPEKFDWETVLTPEQFRELALAVSDERIYDWQDTTVKENTRYLYRVVNGYMVGPKPTELKPVMQDGDTPITETSEPAFSIWRPENISLVSFTPAEGDNPLSGTASFAWTMDETVPEGAKWELRTVRLNVDTNEKETETVEIVPASEGSAFSYVHELSIDEADSTHVTVFNFTLMYTYGDLAEELPLIGTNVALGISDKVPLLDGLRASTDFVGQIVLIWNVTDEQVIENGYSLWIDDAADWVPADGELVSSGNSRTYTVNGVEGMHSYRMKLKGKASDTSSEYEYVCPVTVVGDVLKSPSAPTVTDSISRDSMTVTWTVPASNIIYALECRAKGDTEWMDVDIVTADGTKVLTETDGFIPGAIYEFRMKAANVAQNEWTVPSEIEEGSIFGPGAMDLRVVENGLDPKKITLEWNPVVGADSYKIVRNGTMLSGTVREKNTYEDLSIVNIVPDESNPMPRSAEYEYSVIPYMNDDEHNGDMPASSSVKGRLFGPPANVVASKGTSTGVIDVTWDPVDGAEYYILKPYAIGPDGEFISKGSAIDIKDGTQHSFKAGDESVFFTVCAVKDAGTVISEYQNGFTERVNKFNVAEASNYGYKLRKPEGFFVTEVTGADGFYSDHVTLRWNRVEGAETYMIKSSISDADGLSLDVTGLKYASADDVITNGKADDAAGYLAYDRVKNEYTYNDASGTFRTSTVISTYSMSAKNGSIITEDARDNTIVHRMFTDRELVNIVNYSLYELLHNADREFGGDWFQYGFAADTTKSYTGDKGATVIIPVWGWTGHKTGTVSLSSYSRKNVGAVLTTETDFVNSNDGSVAAEHDPLNFLGSGSVMITIEGSSPGKGYPLMKVTYPSDPMINVISVNDKAEYTVTIGPAVTKVPDSKMLERPF